MSLPHDRSAYRPSGRVHGPVFVALTMLTLLTAVVMAGLLYLAFHAGIYLLGIAPLVATLPVAGMAYWAVGASHCRSRALAGLLGLVAGLVVYFGYYHLDLLSWIGFGHAHRLDLLPRYVLFRVHTDVVRDVGHGQINQQPQNPDTVQLVFRWFFFGMDLAVAAGVPLGVAVARAARAYSEEHGCWMTREIVACRPECADLLLDALTTHDHEAFAEALTPAVNQNHGYAELALDVVPAAVERPTLGEVYLTLAEVGPAVANANRRHRKVLARRWRLDLEEAAAVAARFASVGAAFSGPPAATSPSLPAAGALTERPVSTAVVVTPIPPPYGRTVLTRGHLLVGAVLAALPFVLSTGGGFGLLGLGVYLGEDAGIAGMIALLLGGLASFGGGAWFMIYFGDYLPSRYLYRLSVTALRNRPETLVSPDDPSAVYIQVIPRRNWGKVMLENATDLGFLKADEAAGCLLYEGDAERWRIPVASILSCEVEGFVVGEGAQGGQPFFVAVLRADMGGQVWEAPFTRRHVYRGRRGAKQRQAETLALRELVHKLMPQGPG
jgi:hypothetical protein